MLFKATATLIRDAGFVSAEQKIVRIIEAESKEEVESYWDIMTKQIVSHDPSYHLFKINVDYLAPDVILTKTGIIEAK